MAKLTKVQRRMIERALGHVQAAHRFVMDPRTEVVRRYDVAAFPESTFNRKSDGAQYNAVTKEVGSDLCALDHATRELLALLVAA